MKNIRNNNKVAVTIPFWKNLLHKFIPAPPAEMHFRGEAEIIPYGNEEAKLIYKKFLKYELNAELKQKSVWNKINPSSKVVTYGVGVRLLDMKKPEKAQKIIKLE